MIGRASCRECGKEVRETIGIDITCLGCSRVFQIPNSPEYYLTAALQEVKEVPFMGMLDFIANRNGGGNGDEFSVELEFNIQPMKIERRNRPNRPIPTAHWKSAVRRFQQFTRERIDEMTGFSLEGLLGAENYIIVLQDRVIGLNTLLK